MTTNWARMLFLGDSLTHGSRDPYLGCWPLYMAHLAVKERYTIIPEIDAVPGRVSCELARVGQERIAKSEAHEVFILIGTNDAKDEVNTPVPIFLGNVRLLVDTCLAFSRRPYVLTIPLPDGFGSAGYSTSITERIRKYNESLRSTFQRVVECEHEKGFTDGIHFSVPLSMKVAWSCGVREFCRLYGIVPGA